MSELISGKEALIAICDGIDVEHRMVGVSEFGGNPKTKYLLLDNFLNGRFEFRLKPRTITINGIEVPAPFEPKHGEIFWHIDVREICSYNYKQEWSDSDEYLQLGAWRTEEEIRQVIAALRIAFKPQ